MTSRLIAAIVAPLLALALSAAPAAQAMPSPAPTPPAWGAAAVLTIDQAKQATGFTGALAYANFDGFPGRPTRSTHEVKVATTKYVAPTWYAWFDNSTSPLYPSGTIVMKWPNAQASTAFYKGEFEPATGNEPTRVTARGGPNATTGVLLYDGAKDWPRSAQGYARSGTMLAVAWCSLGYSTLGPDFKPKTLTRATRTALLDCAERLAKAQLAWAMKGTLQ